MTGTAYRAGDPLLQRLRQHAGVGSKKCGFLLIVPRLCRCPRLFCTRKILPGFFRQTLFFLPLLLKAQQRLCSFNGSFICSLLVLRVLQGIRGVEVSFVKWARQHKYTTLRPEDENLAVPKGARLKGKKILQPDALRVLLSTDTRVVRGKVVQDDNIHAYRMAVMTGLRPGELIGMRVGDVEGNRLHLARAINTLNEETTGKNENAIRTVVLHPLAAAELHAQLQQRTFEEGRQLRGDDLIFPMENEHSLYNYWRFYQRCNGIVPPISLYELRHTFVSIIEDAISPAEMRRIVGHSKSMDTYGSYSHAVAGRADKAALAVSETLAEYAPSREKQPTSQPT